MEKEIQPIKLIFNLYFNQSMKSGQIIIFFKMSNV